MTSARGPALATRRSIPSPSSALDRGEVEGERAVQLVDDQPHHLLDLLRRGQARREVRGHAQLGAQVAELARTGHRLRARVGALAAQRLGAPFALARAGGARGSARRALACRSGGGLDGKLWHCVHIGSDRAALERCERG